MTSLNQRIQRVETLKLAFRFLQLAAIIGIFFAAILFLLAWTGELPSLGNVEAKSMKAVWQSLKVDMIASGLCLIAAIVVHRLVQSSAKSLERYEQTHCSGCDFDLAPFIAEKIEKRKIERKTGTAVHGSMYFDIYCPNCKCQKTMRER